MSRTVIIERERSSRREIEKGVFGRIKKDVTTESVTERFKEAHNDHELKRILPQTVTNALITGDQSRSSLKVISPPKSKRQRHYNQRNMKFPDCKHRVRKKRMHAQRMSGKHYHLKCPVCGKVAPNASPSDEIINLRLLTFA